MGCFFGDLDKLRSGLYPVGWISISP
jgi:hypothetical protein